MYIRLSGAGSGLLLLSFAAYRRALAAGTIAASPHDRWDDWSARAFLRDHFQGPGDLHILRAALADEIADQRRMRDDAILGAGAQRLQSGAWCVVQERIAIAVTAGSGSLAHAVAPEQPAPVAVTAPAPVMRPPVPAAPEWPVQADQAAFAAVLVSAARNGTPFCEICAVAARNAASASASAPAPVKEWPEQTDQAAFARVLKQAAQDGTPFCEICARAARRAAVAEMA